MSLCVAEQRTLLIMRTMTEQSQPLAMSVKDAAKALGLGESTVRERIRDGRIKAKKDGARTTIETEELRRYYAELNGA